MSQNEQRRYSRMATRRPAVVQMRGQGLRGEIRDYCQSGLYVAFESPLSAEAARCVTPAESVHVEFTVGAQAFVVPAQVARSLTTGLGLQTGPLGADVLAALGSAVARNAAGAPGKSQTPPTAGFSHVSSGEALKVSHRLFASAMKEVLGSYFDAIAPALLEASDHACAIAQRTQFGYAAQGIAGSRAAITGRFGAALHEALLQPGVPRAVESTASSSSELTLVDDEHFEEWLSLSTVAHQIESDNSLALNQLIRRYGALREHSFDRVSLPFGPVTIGHAFQVALEPLQYPTPIRNVMYRTFGAALRAKSKDLYSALNDALADFDVDEPAAPGPSSRKHRPEAHVSEQATDSQDTHVRSQAAADVAELLEKLGALYRPVPSAPAAASTEYSLERLITTLGRGGPSSPRATPSITPSSAMSPARSAVSTLNGMIDRFMPALPSNASAIAPTMPAELVPRVTDSRDLDRLFDALQAASPNGAAETDPSLNARVAGVLDTLKLPQPARQTLNSASRLLSRAMLESVAQSEIHALISRLERQLLKLSINDSRFLESADHPTRAVIDLLEQYSMATDENGRFFDDGLRRYLQQLVQRLVDRGDEGVSVYENARDLLQRLLAPVQRTRARRVARLQEACEARDSIRRARRRVSDSLNRRIGGRAVPECVLRLLSAGWHHHLLLAAMRDAEGADEFDDAMFLTDRMLEWLGGDAPRGPSFGRDWRALVSRVESSLTRVSVDASTLGACIEDLVQAFTSIEHGGAPPKGVHHPLLSESDLHKETSTLVRAAARLRIGDWW